MPGKSRGGRFRHLPPSKKKKDRRHPLTTATQQQPISQGYKPVSRAEVAAPSVGVPTPIATPGSRYPYMVIELRRIGIIAGILLVILVVLAFVLP